MSIRERAQTEADRWYPTFNHIGAVQNQAFVRGAEWASQQEPSEAEVEAAAESLYPGLFTLSDFRYEIEFDNLAKDRPYHQEAAKDEARAALVAAREVASHE